VTARQCNKTVADLLGIEDEQIAFAVNHEAAEIWFLWEREQEAEKLKAMVTGRMTNQAADAIGEITADNLGDQSW